MTPADLHAARKRLGMTQEQLAQALRLRGRGLRSVQRWEAPGGEVPGPVQVAVEGMLREKAIADAVKAAIEQGARILGPKLDAVALGALEGSFHLGGAIERGATPIVGERSREWVMPITRREPDRP